ncbi:MAG: 50S ribosomal protein L32e [Thaumarchaeota archaeon]|nr:50S ribosomal protein L32e [Nitrososphaerota archaeon]
MSEPKVSKPRKKAEGKAKKPKVAAKAAKQAKKAVALRRKPRKLEEKQVPAVQPEKIEPKPVRVKKQPIPVKKKPVRDLQQLLALRAQINSRRPRFIRQESWRYRRIRENWRKPRGIDSKMRMMVKGWPRIVKVGYRGPRAVRGLHPSGLREVLVSSIGELDKLNPKTDAARFSSTLGRRKRIDLFTKAKNLGIRVLNPSRVTPIKTKGET